MKILYCTSPPNDFNYAELRLQEPNRTMFEKHKDIITVCRDNDIDLRIKCHPCDQEYSERYFKSLIEAYRSNAKIVYLPPEWTIKNYDMLILDYVGTTLLPDMIVVPISKILYLKDTSVLNDNAEIRQDLEAAYHLVTDRKELEDTILDQQRRLEWAWNISRSGISLGRLEGKCDISQ